MYETNYHRADNVDDAVAKLAAAEDGKLVSGGMTLIPTMKQRLAAPSDLIDISKVGSMHGISTEEMKYEQAGLLSKVVAAVMGGGNKPVKVTIGAATTHAEVASSAELAKACPAICDLASHIGDPQVRHRGTIGGSIANNDPAADYPAAMIGLGAEITTNKRSIAADDFFTGMFETALEEDEVVTGVSFIVPEKSAYSKFPNPASRYAMAGVFVSQSADGVRVAVTGAGSNGVFRQGDMEAALASNWGASAVSNCSVDESNMLSDLHGDSAYRANLVKVMAKRAVEAA